jgi:hypothetical protein
MPIDHLANANNGNAVKKVASTTTTLSGRTSGLPIYQVNLSDLKAVLGETLQTVLSSMKVNNDADLLQGYRQPTDHDDRDGNLPAAPGNGVAYREYYVPANSLPKPGYVRLVSDLHNRRLFITPTHYDVWITDREAAKLMDGATPVAPSKKGAQNPFFLVMTKA